MREDLGALILYLLYKHRHGTQTYKLSPKAQEALLHYSYPGNFRELENILERAVALTVGQVSNWMICKSNTPTPKNDHPNLDLDDIADSETRKGETLDHQPLPPFDPRTMQIQDYLRSKSSAALSNKRAATRYNRTQAANFWASASALCATAWNAWTSIKTFRRPEFSRPSEHKPYVQDLF